MITRLLQLLLLFHLSGTYITAQVTITDTFYKRMEGDMDSVSLQANFIRMKKELSGNFEISSADIQTRTIEIQGKINEDNGAVISQLGYGDPIFEGVFVDDRFTGLWYGNSNEGPIDLIESYPDGSLALDIHYLRSESKLIDDEKESPTAEIELTMICPVVDKGNDTILRRIYQGIYNHFYNDSIDFINPDSLLLQAEKAFYKLYREQNHDWHKRGNAFDWLKETSMMVTYNSNYVVCFEYLEYVYTGGAHGMTNLSYDSYNLKKGNKIALLDIFRNGSEKELSDLLTSQIRSDKQIPDSISLKKSGYFIDVIEPGFNFYINGSGIGFVYNPYEIAPYSTGISNIFLNYNKLKNILKENTMVAEIAQTY
jgi:hypothetical protein